MVATKERTESTLAPFLSCYQPLGGILKKEELSGLCGKMET